MYVVYLINTRDYLWKYWIYEKQMRICWKRKVRFGILKRKVLRGWIQVGEFR